MAKKKETIQFESADLQELQKALSLDAGKLKATTEEVVRHSFRVSCGKEDAAEVVIKGKTYPVVNIGNRGLGIRIPDASVFFRGEELSDIEFRFREQKMMLKGLVVHVHVADDEAYLCGISFTEMSAEQEKMLLELLQQQRLTVFGRE